MPLIHLPCYNEDDDDEQSVCNPRWSIPIVADFAAIFLPQPIRSFYLCSSVQSFKPPPSSLVTWLGCLLNICCAALPWLRIPAIFHAMRFKLSCKIHFIPIIKRSSRYYSLSDCLGCLRGDHDQPPYVEEQKDKARTHQVRKLFQWAAAALNPLATR